MQPLWFLVAVLLGTGLFFILPVLFEKEVRESRFLSLTYRLKYLQHLFPDKGDELRALWLEWLPNKERWEKLNRESIGLRIRTVRQLTGSNILEAVSLSAELVREIVEWKELRPTKLHAEDPFSVGEVLKLLAERVDKDFKVGNDLGIEGRRLREWLNSHPIDFEQVVELILAAVEILVSRLPTAKTAATIEQLSQVEKRVEELSEKVAGMTARDTMPPALPPSPKPPTLPPQQAG